MSFTLLQYVNQRLQIQLELLMMSGVPLETCSAFNEQWNNKLCYKVASCWLFLLNNFPKYCSPPQIQHVVVTLAETLLVSQKKQ
jgi:hypothetical protein